MKTKCVAIALCCFVVLWSGLVMADSKYPNRPITIIQYAGPGSSSDIVTKVLIEVMKKQLNGTPIVIKYATGGGGSVSLTELAKSKPDGYTIGVGNMGGLAVVPNIRKVKYDPLKDFVYHGSYMVFVLGWCVRSDSPYMTFKDLIEAARKNPGKIRWGNPSPGGFMGLGAAYIEKVEKVRFKNVPFSKATAEAMTALLGGHIDVMPANPPIMKRFMAPGKIRMLMSCSEIRHTDPNVPTLKELGYEFEQASYACITSPKGISANVKKRLDDAVRNAVKDPVYVKATKKMDTPIGYLPGDKFKKKVEANLKIWGDLLKQNYRF